MTVEDAVLAAEFGIHITASARAAGYDIDAPRGGGRTQLAKDTGMSLATVSRMMAGQAIPDARAIEPLALALGLPPFDLLARAGIITNELALTALKPPTPRRLTNRDALTHLGVVDDADRSAILAVIARLKARPS
jgi:transcriptional regulator with XRE-family HTH domain